MSRDSYNAATVPWYAHRDTKPLRHREPRSLYENVIRDKIQRGRAFQALYCWVRDNWHGGEAFYMLPSAPAHPNYNLADRFGIYREMRPQGNLSRIFVDWLDDGHRINIEVSTFYRCAVQLDENGNPIELPAITFL